MHSCTLMHGGGAEDVAGLTSDVNKDWTPKDKDKDKDKDLGLPRVA